ncbi:hypothetical protein LCGC14_2090550, partial [marine sediment metagenome]
LDFVASLGGFLSGRFGLEFDLGQRAMLGPPLANADESLVAGQLVELSGVLFTARDQAHLRLVKALTEGRALPVDLKGQTIYYAGPAPARPNAIAGSIGPTTAARMDAYTPALLEYGIKAMIGKGRRSAEVEEAIQIAAKEIDKQNKAGPQMGIEEKHARRQFKAARKAKAEQV